MKRISRLVAFAGAIACVGGSVACDGRPKVKGSSSGGASQPRTGPTVAVVDLSGGVPEIEPAGFLGVAVHRASFDRLLQTAREVTDDAEVKGVFLRFGGARIGIARAEEIGDLFAAVRERKPVYCHADDLGNATMYAAARACSKIYVSPAGGVDSVGIAAQMIYFHKLLADELHLSVDFLQVGKYKGAEEPFTRDGPSDEARASLSGALKGIRATWLDGVKKGRGHDDVESAVEDGPYSGPGAKAKGLVDEVGYSDDALEAEKKATGAVRDETRFGGGAKEQDDDLADFVRLLAGSHGGTAPVALIRASGSIAMSRGRSLLGGASGITEHDMAKLLARCEREDSIKAVVIRIDSPGGSALASDLIWHEVQKVRAKKPVVVSMGDLAASGGYYISSAANVIFAEPTSIVGSIGVVGGKVAVGDALERIGVHAETIPASDAPGAGARAAYESLLTGWDDATRARLLETMRGVYELFLARIAEGRGTTPDKIAPFAEGRVFSGTEAKEHGLVDDLGGLRDAIVKARALASLAPDASISVLSENSGLLESLGGESGDSEEEAPVTPVSGVSNQAAGALERLAPDLIPFVTSLAGMAVGANGQRPERALVALPYALVVR